MLQSLDTLIAFVVIMTIVSLFVTILVQMISAALSLRGKNLANALALTFQTIDPALAESAHQLAAKILSDPLLSDSTRTEKNRNGASTGPRTEPWHFLDFWKGASKLANAIRPEEAYEALKKLAKGFNYTSPGSKAAQDELTTAQQSLLAADTPVLTSAAIAAIALAETKLAAAKSAELAQFKDDFTSKKADIEVAQTGLADAGDLAAKHAAQVTLTAKQNAFQTFCAGNLPGTAHQLMTSLGVPADKAAVATETLAAFNSLAGALPGNLQADLNKALTATSARLVGFIDTEQKKFEDWFGSAQDRAQQWFQLHTRGITIGASIVIAFWFQLDAVEVFHYVSTNSSARAALVGSAETVIKQGAGVLEEKSNLIERINDAWGKPERTKLAPDELKKATTVKELETKLSEKTTAPAKFDSAAFKQKVDETIASDGNSDLIGRINEAWSQPAHVKLTPAEIKGVTNTKQLEEALTPKPEFDLAAFNETVRKTADAYYKEKNDTIRDLTKEVSATGFELIPRGFWRWTTDVPAKPAFWEGWYFFWSYWRHTLGMLLFAGLLTLGAPYWYNLLKNLTSLRPALAQLIGNEEESQAQPKKKP